MSRISALLLAYLLASPLAAQIESSDYSPQGLESLAELRYAEGRLTEARHLYREIAAKSSDSGERGRVLVLAAWLAHLEERYPESQSDLLEALGADPDLVFQAELYNQAFVDLYHRSRDLAHNQRLGDAHGHLERGIKALADGDLATARLAFDQVLWRIPNDLTATYNLALVDLQSGQMDSAIAGFEKVEALAISSQGPARTGLRVKALTNLALLFQQRGSGEDAVLTLQKALELDPTQPQAWSNLGLSQRSLGHKREATDAFRRAYELAPEQSASVVNLAISYIDQELWSEAATVLRQATITHPDDVSIWLHLGLSQRGGGELELAATALARALELDPDNHDGLAARATADLALVRLQLGDSQGAQEAARQTLVWRPGDPPTLRILGIALSRLGELDAARETLERAFALDPSDAETANNLGTVFFAQKDWANAERSFAKAVEIRPGFLSAQDNLAKARANRMAAAATPGSTKSKKQKKKPASLGVGFAKVDYSELGLNGALVETVRAGTPASKSGLRKGDLLLKIDGQAIRGGQDVSSYLHAFDGSTVTFDLLREGRPMRVKVKVR